MVKEMEKDRASWRMSLKEPPPPYFEASPSGEPPSSPTTKRNLCSDGDLSNEFRSLNLVS